MGGKFIVIDGVADLSTPTAVVYNYLLHRQRGPVRSTKEPTNSEHVKHLSRMLREDHDKEWVEENRRNEYVGHQLLDRIKHVKEVILPGLKEGAHVVSERYKYYTYAYWSLLGANPEELHLLHRGLPVPDLTVIVETEQPKLIPVYPRCIAGSAYRESVGVNYHNLNRILPEENIVLLKGSDANQQIIKSVEKLL